MKHIRRYEIDSSKITKIHNVEYISDLKIVIYKKNRYSFGIFDKDTGDTIFLSEHAYTLNQVYIAVIRKISEVINEN